MSKGVKNKSFLDEIILEVEKELEEETTSGDIAGYETPNAFSGGDNKSKKKTRDVSTQAGYTIVSEVTKPTKANLGKPTGKELKLKKGDSISYMQKKGTVSFVGRSDGDLYYDIKLDSGKIIKQIPAASAGSLKRESKLPVKRTNRWLEMKNDETMHTNKKLAKGMMNLRNQLSEVEKYLGWYNKLKNVNETEASTYWKRTNTNIRKIKERIYNIARTLQELEK